MNKVILIAALSLIMPSISYAEDIDYEKSSENAYDLSVISSDENLSEVAGKKENTTEKSKNKKQKNKSGKTEETASDDDAENGENSVENAKEGEVEVVEEYIKNPTDFSADFMNSLYLCQPYTEYQKVYSIEEKVSIIGPSDGKCLIRYDMFDLQIPTGLVMNIHSLDDIKQLLHNRDITSYRPQYDYSGLLFEIDECRRNKTNHNQRLERLNKYDIAILQGLTSKYSNGKCVITLLNQLTIGDYSTDYSVKCTIGNEDLNLISETYKNILQKYAKDPNDEAVKKADTEILYRLQQMGYCKKMKTYK